MCIHPAIAEEVEEEEEEVEEEEEEEEEVGEEEEEEEVTESEEETGSGDNQEDTSLSSKQQVNGAVATVTEDGVSNLDDQNSCKSNPSFSGPQLDNMLARIKKLREERKQILSDMKMLKTVFKDEENTDVNKQEDKVTTPKESSQGIRCFICQCYLGKKLNIGAVVHMGLEDGDPICTKALFLTEESKDKIKSVAAATQFSLEKKFELLCLSSIFQSSETSTKETLTKAESFLDHIERQRSRDKEEQAAIKSGQKEVAVVDVVGDEGGPNSGDREEFNVGESFLLQMERQRQKDMEAKEKIKRGLKPVLSVDRDNIEEHTPKKLSQSAEKESLEETARPAQRLSQDLLRAIRASDRQQLVRVSCDDRSEVAQRGKVLRPDLAPTVALAPFRDLLRQITSQSRSPGLRHVRAIDDRSAPYIPDDIEVFCVGERKTKTKKDAVRYHHMAFLPTHPVWIVQGRVRMRK